MVLMRLMWAATLLLLLAGKAAGLVAAPPRQAGAARCVAPRPRAPPPRAVLADPAAAAALAAAAVQPLPLATTTLLAADMFGKTFLAGISIAAATLVTTIFVGIIVRGRYDELEQSFFEAQEAALQQVEVEEVDSEVADYFGDNLNPREIVSQPPREKRN